MPFGFPRRVCNAGNIMRTQSLNTPYVMLQAPKVGCDCSIIEGHFLPRFHISTLSLLDSVHAINAINDVKSFPETVRADFVASALPTPSSHAILQTPTTPSTCLLPTKVASHPSQRLRRVRSNRIILLSQVAARSGRLHVPFLTHRHHLGSVRALGSLRENSNIPAVEVTCLHYCRLTTARTRTRIRKTRPQASQATPSISSKMRLRRRHRRQHEVS
jgi:hypothetical protein